MKILRDLKSSREDSGTSKIGLTLVLGNVQEDIHEEVIMSSGEGVISDALEVLSASEVFTRMRCINSHSTLTP